MKINNFESDSFAIQWLAKGSFVDNEVDKCYLIEAYTIRLNHVALNTWILSGTMNTRDCYDTNDEWEAHKAEYKLRRENVNKQIIEALKIDSNDGSVCITQSQSEVFTVVHIREIG